MSKKPFGVSTIYILLGLLFIAVVAIRTISTPEIWTHLAQGRANAPISFLECDSPVNTTHLYDKLAFMAWNIGGAPLLIILNVIGILAAFTALLPVAKKWGGELSQGFALLVAGFLMFNDLDVDPKTIMMLFAALFMLLLSTQKNPIILFAALVPVQILWTNMHGSFLFGPLIALLATIEAGQNASGPKRKKKKGPDLKILAALTVVLLLATLANPYLTGLHKQVFSSIAAPYPLYLSSLFFEYFQPPTHGPLVIFVFILGAGGLITLKKKLPVMLTTLAIIGAFLVFRSISAARLFAVLAFPFLVLSSTAVGEHISSSFKLFLDKHSKLLMPVTQAIFALVVILSIIPICTNTAYAKLGSASVFGLGVEEELYPAGAEAIIEHPAFPKKVLNLDAADGGYLAWKYPERKIFIDYRQGRYDRKLLEDISAIMMGNTKAYDKFYETYRPEAIIINTLGPRSAQGLVTLLSRSIWKLVYFDGTTAVLLLNKAEFAPILEDTEVQVAGLKRLEAARAAYADKVNKKGKVGNSAELIGSGKVFLAFNRPAESKAIFSLLLQSNSRIPGAWIGLGNSQLFLKEFDTAVESLDTATKLAPNNIFAWISYATACKYAGNEEELKRAQEKIKQLAEEQQAEETEEELEEALDIAPENTKKALQDIEIPE